MHQLRNEVKRQSARLERYRAAVETITDPLWKEHAVRGISLAETQFEKTRATLELAEAGEGPLREAERVFAECDLEWKRCEDAWHAGSLDKKTALENRDARELAMSACRVRDRELSALKGNMASLLQRNHDKLKAVRERAENVASTTCGRYFGDKNNDGVHAATEGFANAFRNVATDPPEALPMIAIVAATALHFDAPKLLAEAPEDKERIKTERSARELAELARLFAGGFAMARRLATIRADVERKVLDLVGGPTS